MTSYEPPPPGQGPPPPPGQGQPPQEGQGEPPPGGPGQPPPKKPFYKKWWVIALAALVVVAVIISSTGKEEDGNEAASPDAAASESAPSEPDPAETTPEVTEEAPPATTPEETEEAPPAGPGIGTPVRDGKFEFVVNSVECGLTQIGSADFGVTAQGQFCLVNVSVTNIGDEPQSFSGDSQKLFNEDGQEYSASTEAAIYLPEANSLFQEINPGNQLAGVVVFDIPADAVPVRIELHDSPFSGGVEVSLQ